jgi:hypothetical protein
MGQTGRNALMADWDDGWKLKVGATGGGDLVDDTSPQLGGDLDPNGFGPSGAWVPNAANTYALGSSAEPWADLFLGSGAVINFDASDVTITHSANSLSIFGGYTFHQYDEQYTAPVYYVNANDSSQVQLGAYQARRATPAANDEAYVDYYLNDSALNNDTFARLTWRAKDVTSTSEDGELAISVISAGSLTECFRIGANYVELDERTAPAAPAANKVRIFCRDNGAGKTQLCALFPTGAVQQIAIEP